jgi:hypothetical protein
MTTWTKPRKNGLSIPSQPQRLASTPSSPAPADPDRVRARAYELFLARRRDNTPGNAESDWITAEREIRGELREKPTPHSALRGETLLHSDDD